MLLGINGPDFEYCPHSLIGKRSQMLFQSTIFFLFVNIVVTDRWARKKFGEFPAVVRLGENPCRSCARYFEEPMASDVRNDSSTFRCWMWLMSGNMLAAVERMITSLPIESDFVDISITIALEVLMIYRLRWNLITTP